MKNVSKLCVLLCATVVLSGADPTGPTAAQLDAFERFTRQPGVRVVWSSEAGNIQSDSTEAVITALAVEDGATPGRRVRGLRIDFRGMNAFDRVYLAEEHVEPAIGMLLEIEGGVDRFFSSRVGQSSCFGSGAFLRAMRQGAHSIFPSQCSMPDGWFGLSVHTGKAKFRFTAVRPQVFAAALARANAELKRR